MLFISFVVLSSISVERYCCFPFLNMGTFGTKIRDIDDFELYIQKFQLLNFSILSG